MVEIICHGGNKNIKRIMNELINAGKKCREESLVKHLLWKNRSDES